MGYRAEPIGEIPQAPGQERQGLVIERVTAGTGGFRGWSALDII
jgi:hypothetical protein